MASGLEYVPKKGDRVQLHGLSTAVLNEAEGCIVGPVDAETGRHPVKLLKPSEAVAAFPGGVKVKAANLKKVQVAAPALAKPVKPRKPIEDGYEGPGAAGMAPDSWMRGLSPAQQAEWFVDCYRMRVDDDMCWGGGNLHGLYNPDCTGDDIAADFLLFCKLAVAARVVPYAPGWNWGECLKKAAKLLGFAFEKSDAKEKYGGENVFAALTGGRSLRATAELVYRSSCQAGDESEAVPVMRTELGLDNGPEQAFEELLELRPEPVKDIGGAVAWQRLRQALANVR